MAEILDDQIVVYEVPDGEFRVDIRVDQQTDRLTQAQMAELFGGECSVVTKHIQNAFQEGELNPAATCANLGQVRTEGVRMATREVEHYNLLEDGR
jgi:hypothetical protein